MIKSSWLAGLLIIIQFVTCQSQCIASMLVCPYASPLASAAFPNTYGLIANGHYYFSKSNPNSDYNLLGCLTATTGRFQSIQQFSPSTSGSYKIELSHYGILLQNGVGRYNFYYRDLTGSCTINNFICLQPVINNNNFTLNHFTTPQLTAGHTYDFLLELVDSSIFQGTSTFEDYYFNVYCNPPSGLQASSIGPDKVTTTWNCTNACSGPTYLEYGPKGFTPGTGSSAGVGGTVIANVSSPYTITGLTPKTNYDIYLRSNCNMGFSVNNTVLKIKTSMDCSTAATVQCGSIFTYGAFEGEGSWNDYACSPNVGYNGNEKIYLFTPTGTANYTINYTQRPTNYSTNIGVYYKEATGTCDQNDWICATKLYSASAIPTIVSLGSFQAGKAYYLMIDGFYSTSQWPLPDFKFELMCPSACNIDTGITVTPATAQSRIINTSCNTCTGNAYLEYGPAGFIPGIDSVAGTGILIPNVTFPFTLSGLAPNSTFDFYLRRKCATGYSNNSFKTTFNTTSCNTSPVSITANPVSAPCSGTQVTLSQTGGALLSPGAQYVWYLSGNVIGTGPSINVSPTVTSTYQVRIESTCGNSQFISKTQTIVYTVNISSPTTMLCTGSSVLLTATTTGSGLSYQWQLNSANIAGATTATYNATTPGIYTCIISRASANCSVTSNSITLTSLNNTLAVITSPTTTLCNGPLVITANNDPGLTFKWYLNNTIISGATSSTYTAQNAGDYSCVITNTSGCTSTSNVISITTGGNLNAFAISGTTGFCRSSSNNIYSIVNPQSGVNYNWTFPSGATIVSGQGSSSVNVSYSSTAAAGSISVTGTNSCGTSTAAFTLVLRTSVSTPGTITGSSIGCTAESKVYTIRKVANADYYKWLPPIGATINGSSSAFVTTDTNVVVTYTASFTGDTLRVQSGNCRGLSGERKLRINKTSPSTPGTIAGLKNGLCNTSSNIYSVTAVSNATSYTWRTNIANATINGNPSPVTTTTPTATINFGNFSFGQIYVKANNNCGSSNERSATVYARPATPASITGPATLCTSQASVSFSTISVANASAYNWTVPSGSTITSGQNTLSILMSAGANATTGNVRVRAQNSCASSAYLNKSVTISSCPRVESEIETIEYSIYPNPVKDVLYIELKYDFKSPVTIQITDVSGRIILENILRSESQLNVFESDLSAFLHGVYILNINTVEFNKTVKFIKM